MTKAPRWEWFSSLIIISDEKQPPLVKAFEQPFHEYSILDLIEKQLWNHIKKIKKQIQSFLLTNKLQILVCYSWFELSRISPLYVVFHLIDVSAQIVWWVSSGSVISGDVDGKKRKGGDREFGKAGHEITECIDVALAIQRFIFVGRAEKSNFSRPKFSIKFVLGDTPARCYVRRMKMRSGVVVPCDVCLSIKCRILEIFRRLPTADIKRCVLFMYLWCV